MALPSEPSVEAFHAVATALPAVALIVTLGRLWYRIQRKLAWWDDLLVAAGALFMVLLVVGIWLLTGAPKLTQSAKIASYYLCTYTFTLANYFARLSILVGIIRIAPNARMRQVLKGMLVLFVAIMCTLLAQKIWVCDGGSKEAKSWKLRSTPTCRLGLQVAVTELVTDIICDAILVIAPLSFLARSSLKPSQKRRLYAIFGASVATTIVSVVQDWLILAAGGYRELTASMIEVAISVIVANLPVMVSLFYRLLRARKGDDNSQRFATDYEHTRRAKPSAWAGPRDLISSSDPASKQHMTSLGIQLSEVRRTMSASYGRPNDIELDLDDDDDDEVEKKHTSLVGTRPAAVVQFEEGSDRTSERGRRDNKHTRKASNVPDGPGFTTSNISFGHIVGRDAEYDIDIVEDLDRANVTGGGGYPGSPPPDAHSHYRTRPYGLEFDRPFAHATTPTAPQWDRTPSTDYPSNHSPISPYNGPAQRDSYLFPPELDTPYSNTIDVPSLPATAVVRGQQEQHIRAQPSIGGAIASAIRRTGSTAARLANNSNSKSRSNSRTPNTSPDRSPSQSRSRSSSSSRSNRHVPNTAIVNDANFNSVATTAAADGARGALAGFLGRAGGGVLVQQHTIVSMDPTAESPRGRGKR